MKKHITVAIITAVLMGAFHTGCQENNGNTPVITMQNTRFDGAQGNCTNGGVKHEVLVDGNVDETQTQYICDGVLGQDGQNGQVGSSSTVKTTKFDDAQGNCTNGGVKIEVLVDNVVDETQTQYICNGVSGQDGQNGQVASSTTLKTTKFDDAQGDCTNGGVKIEVLVNNVVDDTQTQYICNGTLGQAGQNGQAGSSTTLKTTKFDNEQGDCTNGGVKIEVLVDGVVDDTQTQYICNGTLGQDGQNGQDGANTTVKTTKFDGAQGDCTNGGVKIEVLIDGVVDDTQTQYVCNGAGGLVYCNSIVVDTKIDSANCGSCGNVCEVNTECVNATCQPIADLSTATIICNAQTVTPADDTKNCGGCGIACENFNLCKLGSCEAIPVSVGAIITFGHYEQDNDTTNGKEPIEWRVLDINADGQFLVISEKVLEKKKYNETNIDITWEKSLIRSWLNGYDASYNSNAINYADENFIDTAFTAEEQAKIVASTVPAHKNPFFSTSPGNATTDKIFLLSIVESNEYFADYASRQADTTHYAVKQGMIVLGSESNSSSSDGSCAEVHCYANWWLRSPGSAPYRAANVTQSGSFNNEAIVYIEHGVRPAMWLDN